MTRKGRGRDEGRTREEQGEDEARTREKKNTFGNFKAIARLDRINNQPIQNHPSFLLLLLLLSLLPSLPSCFPLPILPPSHQPSSLFFLPSLHPALILPPITFPPSLLLHSSGPYSLRSSSVVTFVIYERGFYEFVKFQNISESHEIG
jgi:hypothetical protein